MQIDGTTRYYLAYVPTDYDPDTPLPLVFALHGMNMNNWWAAHDSSGFNLIENSNDSALLVYPQGGGDAPGTQSRWGDIDSNWSPGPEGADERFIDALLQLMRDDYCVDTSRIFVTGFSMGGWMTETLACDHTDVFRAYAPVAGWGPGDMSTGHGAEPYCDNASAAVPILITQGATDTIAVPEYCGEPSRDFWIARNGCSRDTEPALANCVAYQGCDASLDVNYCTHGGDHYVPSEAGPNIWAFFSSFD